MLEPLLRVALDIPPEQFERGQGLVVVRYKVVAPEEDIEFMEPEMAALGVEVERVEDEVEVVAPVVHLGHVRVLERVLDGQGMEVENVVQERLHPFVRVRFEVLDIDPENPLRILDRIANPAGGPVEVERARTFAKDDAHPRFRPALRLRRSIGVEGRHRVASA